MDNLYCKDCKNRINKYCIKGWGFVPKKKTRWDFPLTATGCGGLYTPKSKGR